ncbi:hypothetical protein ACQPT2_04240 [Erwinia amylovora]
MATGTRPDGEIFASGASEGEVLDFPSVPRGWGVTVDGKDPDGTKVTDGTNGIPPMEWFNALQQRTDAAILWLLQNAWPDWEKGTWPKGATVVNGDTVWRAQKETPIEPTDTTGDWLALFPLANLDKRYLHADTEGNYLHVDKNLADVEDASASLANIGGVPTTRKINSKALSADITLSAGDVDAFPAVGGTVGSKGVISPSGFSAIGAAMNAAIQGMHLEWNAEGAGEGDIVIHRGTGSGGLRIRGVNADNSANEWIVSIDGSGNLNVETGQCKEMGQRVYSPNNPPPITNSAVTSIRLGSEVVKGIGSPFRPEAGHVCTGFNQATSYQVMEYYSRPLQMIINSAWVTIGQL